MSKTIVAMHVFAIYLATSDVVFSIKHKIIESKPTCPPTKV
jgi:hypothetical protein